MAGSEASTRSKLIAVAPAPRNGHESAHRGVGMDSAESVMPYTCQNCAKRKVKCDKTTPTCSSCRRGKLECLYQPPPPRSRKRKLSAGVLDRLARYERILHQHGLLDSGTPSSTSENPSKNHISLNWNTPATSSSGRLVTDDGKSRFINSNLWSNLGDDEM